jgi:hypothetical protein
MMALCLIVSPRAFAQDGAMEKDPFYPPEQRPAAAVPPLETDDWGRDPFHSPFSTEAPARKQQEQAKPKSEIKLTGIIYGKSARFAIIGGETLAEGGMVGDEKVVAIRSRSVVIKNAAGATEEIFLQDFSNK